MSLLIDQKIELIGALQYIARLTRIAKKLSIYNEYVSLIPKTVHSSPF